MVSDWFGFVPLAWEIFSVVEQVRAVVFIESKVNPCCSCKHNDGDWEIESPDPTEERTGDGRNDFRVILVHLAEQSDAGQIAGNSEKDVRCEAGIEIAYYGKFENIVVTIVRAPRSERDIAKGVDVVKGEHFECCAASKTIQVGSGKLFTWRKNVLPNQRSQKLRSEGIAKPFPKPDDVCWF